MKKVFLILIILSLLFLGAQSVAAEETPVITLEAAHQMAVESHPTVKSIVETVTKAKLLKAQAVTLFLPQLSAHGAITRNDQEISLPDFSEMMSGGAPAGSGSELVIQEEWNRRFGLTASIILLDPQTFPILKASEEYVESEQYNSTYLTNEFLFSVTVAYYAVRTREEAVKIAEENLEAAEENLRLASARLALGDATRVDVLQAEIAEQDKVAALADVRDSLKLSRTTLAHLIGSDDNFATTEPVPPQPVAGSPEELQQQGIDERLDIKSLELREQIAKRRKSQTWAKWLPIFDANYVWGWDSATGFAGQNESWRLIFGARWNLLEGGAKVVEVKQRQSDIMSAHYRLEDLRLNVREEIKRAFLSVQRAERNVELSTKQLELAEESQRLAQKQYERGLTTALELLEATNTLSTARRSLLLSELNRNLTVLALNKATGAIYSQAQTAQ